MAYKEENQLMGIPIIEEILIDIGVNVAKAQESSRLYYGNQVLIPKGTYLLTLTQGLYGPNSSEKVWYRMGLGIPIFSSEEPTGTNLMWTQSWESGGATYNSATILTFPQDTYVQLFHAIYASQTSSQLKAYQSILRAYKLA